MISHFIELIVLIDCNVNRLLSFFSMPVDFSSCTAFASFCAAFASFLALLPVGDTTLRAGMNMLGIIYIVLRYPTDCPTTPAIVLGQIGPQ